MSRTKPNADQQQQRRFISPSNLRSSDAKPNKLEEYRSADKDRAKEEPLQQRPDKSKSQLSSEAPSRSTTQKPNPPERSRSKERKDYMTTNLARLARKKEEKLSSSNVSDHSNPQQKQPAKPRYVYTFKEESKPRNEVSQEYAQMPSSIHRAEPSPASSQLSPLLPSQITPPLPSSLHSNPEPSEMPHSSNNTSVAISSKGKPIEVNVVRYEDHRGSFRTELKQAFKEPPKEQSIPRQEIQQLPSAPAPVEQPQTIQGLSFKRIPVAEPSLSRQQPLTQPSSNELILRVRRLQSQKLTLQQSNSRLLEEKLQVQGEAAFLATKCQQLEREVEAMREAAGRSSRETERAGTANQRLFKELEERYNALLQEYRTKGKQLTESAAEVAALERRSEQLAKALRGAEEEMSVRGMEAEKARRIYEARLLQSQQEAEFQLKQMELRMAAQLRSDPQLEDALHRAENDLAASNRQSQQLQARIEELEYQLRDRDELEGLLRVRDTENRQLQAELTDARQLLAHTKATSADALHRVTAELKDKERLIKELTENNAQARSRDQMQKLSLNAQSDLFGNAGSAGQDSSSFAELIRSQSEETNKLRSQLWEREEALARLGQEADELRERVRRGEQEAQLTARTHTAALANAQQLREATELMLKKRIAALEALRTLH